MSSEQAQNDPWSQSSETASSDPWGQVKLARPRIG